MNKILSDINKANVFSTTHNAAVSAGDIRVAGSMVYFVLNDAAANVAHSGAWIIEKVQLDAVTANTFALGAKVYWNGTTNRATSSTSSTTYIGTAIKAKTATETTVEVAFFGMDRS